MMSDPASAVTMGDLAGGIVRDDPAEQRFWNELCSSVILCLGALATDLEWHGVGSRTEIARFLCGLPAASAALLETPNGWEALAATIPGGGGVFYSPTVH